MASTKSTEAAEEVQYYEKPGQRQPTPSPGAGDRVFYETLFKEKPKSDLALVWLMEHGTFPMEVARAKYEDYLAAKQRLKEINARPTEAASGKSTGGKERSPKVLVEPAADPGLSLTGDERMGQSSV